MRSNQQKELKEFLRASTNNILFLLLAREALLTHPKISLVMIGDWSEHAAMCRLLLITIPTMIDKLLEIYKGASFPQWILTNKLSNEERIKLLQQYLEDFGGTETEDILADYLAIKYLQKAVVYMDWEDYERQYVESRGFPSNLSMLNHQHCELILSTFGRMLKYFYSPFNDILIDILSDLPIIITEYNISRAISGFIKGSDLIKVWWNNLEKINMWLIRGLVTSQQDIENLCEVAIDSWNKYFDATIQVAGISQQTIEKSTAVLNQLYSLRIYPLMPIGVDLRSLAAKRDIVKEAVMTLQLDPMDAQSIENALREIAMIKESTEEELPIWSEKIPIEIASQVLPLFVSLPPEFSPRDVVLALRVGRQVYDFMPNRTPLDLFLDLIPRLVPKLRAKCLDIGRTALAMFKLSTIWYSWVESVKNYPYSMQPFYDLWYEFEQLIQKLESNQ